MYQYITHHLEDRLCYITLNRPEKRNAFNYDIIAELKACLRSEASNKNSKIIILKANGDVFSAGADLDYLQKLQNFTYEENVADSSHLKELFEMIYTFPKVIIAQIEGHAIAGGCGLATVCDFSFAVPEAKFGYTEVKIGFIPAIVSYFLVKKIGEGKARELLLTGKLIDAIDAKSSNIINYISTKETIADEVRKFANALCSEASASSLAMTKKLIAELPVMDYASALQKAAEENASARGTEDCKKGIATFLSKEKMVW